MKLLSSLAFAVVLGVVAFTWGLYVLEPNLLLGTPWGPVHVALLVLASFSLGLLVMGLYVLSGWVNAQTALYRRSRELKQVREELQALKRQHPEEIPVIPDRSGQ
ncbi:MAG: LapA family protein [Meiothermus sp.]|uniref:LapA family protein n=1 Tax=Meiothermus sp. TaxID=1955249 RepID=UPI0025D578DA|nr:LapA family protein [Meiothermus sp.]MCS7059130.1 LapA family protein [Meiothermus sp.]MCS7195498.1 LapA family protein [Meiothermus sp.]MCX7741192.1 LapA family protein [Meiothermus sp.]MDW8090426.1 LapA family protein [Meiothermus sp.]MDW8481073.1 LapA family protein [Meiothermus sp.]